MEANLELVEKLVEKTGISYTEAKAVLVKTDWTSLRRSLSLKRRARLTRATPRSIPPETAAAIAAANILTRSAGKRKAARQARTSRQQARASAK